MKIFLSSSGQRSREVSLALREWLPLVHHSVEPFSYAADIAAGTQWQRELTKQLAEAEFGILCVTASNQLAPWVCFEAGALSNALEASRVVPLAIDLDVRDIDPPLAQFQGHQLSRKGMADVILAIDAAMPRPKGEQFVRRAVDVCWPELDRRLVEILALSRSPGEQVEEAINAARSFSGAHEGMRYAAAAFGKLSRARVALARRREAGETTDFRSGIPLPEALSESRPDDPARPTHTGQPPRYRPVPEQERSFVADDRRPREF